MQDTLFTKLVALVFAQLGNDCPVLSGNMSSHISYGSISPSEALIIVSGPSYDLSEWRKNRRIVLTNEFDYASSVNNLGAFMGKSKKSKHWANKSVVRACQIFAAEYPNMEVINNVAI